MARHSAPPKPPQPLLGASALAALAVVALAVAISLLGRQEEPAPQSGTQAPEGMMYIEDRYRGEILIPQYDIPLNQYDPEKFVEEGGLLRYNDGVAALGVDVSSHQGEIDWYAVREAGIQFAILRLGFRGMTEGNLNLDDTFQQNYQGAVDAGLQVGVYFFSQAVSEEEAREEADFVLEALGGRALQYPVVFDWETPLPSDTLPAEELRAHGLSGEEVTRCALAFCQRVEEAGYTPCIYTNKTMAYETFNLEELSAYPLWYAEYQPVPSLYYHFDLWQYSATGAVPGIFGSVDLDICFAPY